jgi:general secretion pathway protein A
MRSMRKRRPFSISPNPSYLFLTPALKATLHKTRYVIDERQGLTAILGDPGLGKSSIARLLHAEYSAREDTVAAFIPTPNFASDYALMKEVCGEYGLPARRSLQAQEQEIRAFLVKVYTEDRNAVLFIDEAQKLQPKMLEQVRVMLNYETDEDKLIQIVLIGQIELLETLRDPKRKAIRSRLFAPSILAPLSLTETRQIIAFRCELAEIPSPFPDETIELLYSITGGVPRDVLKVCAIASELAKLNGEKFVPPEAIPYAAEQARLDEDRETEPETEEVEA